MKRLPEAGYRNGSPPGYSEQELLEGHIRTSRHLSLSPGAYQRGCRETQSKHWLFIPGLQRNQVMLLPKDKCKLLKPEPTPDSDLVFCDMGVLFGGWGIGGVVPHRLSANASGEKWGMGVCGKERRYLSRWPSLQREVPSYLVTTVAFSLHSLQLPLEECLDSSLSQF